MHGSRLICPFVVLGVAGAIPIARTALANPIVWVIDDGEKIKQDAVGLPLATGASNPVWSPGAPVRLFALQNETVAFQVVVQADATAIDGLTVDVGALAGPGAATIQNDPGATDPTNFVGRPVERFVEHYFDVTRASGGATAGQSLGWARGSGPSPGAWTGLMPDALIPVEVAPTWDPYPMHVAANRNGVVWIDVTVSGSQAPGTYRGVVSVAAAGQPLASLPIELDVLAARLPDRPLQTMLYYDRSELDRRIGGGDAAEANLWKLFHRHRISPMHDAETASDLTRHIPALDGTEYTAGNGYDGPGVGLGDGILSLGAYGSYGAPTASTLSEVEGIADVLAQHQLFATTEAFVYAVDETCGSPYGAKWKSLISGSQDANAKNVRVGWTCSDGPAKQPVDIPIVFASSYDPGAAAAASAAGKEVWIYNGQRPETDAFFTDTSAIALRANAWIAAMAGIPRWFYWETTFWYDENRGGHGAYDPFVTPETFHNSGGDYCEGDGVLVYPGKQVDGFTEHSINVNGVLPSIRLKSLRRGIEDAGYYALAHATSAAKAEAIAQGLLARSLSTASEGSPVSWTEGGGGWFQARRALLALIPQQAPAPTAGGGPSGSGDGGIPGLDGSGAGQAAGSTGTDGSTADAPVGYGDDTAGYGVSQRPVGPPASGPTGPGCSTGGASGGEPGLALEIAFALLAIVCIRRKRPAERTPALRHGNGCAGRPRSK